MGDFLRRVSWRVFRCERTSRFNSFRIAGHRGSPDHHTGVSPIRTQPGNRTHGIRHRGGSGRIKWTKARDLRLCVHLILGFPTENRAEILDTAGFLNRMGIDGIKLHNLHVIKNTALEKIYLQGHFELLSKEEYISLLIEFVELLSPEIVIHPRLPVPIVMGR